MATITRAPSVVQGQAEPANLEGCAGRPSKYTPENVAAICAAVTDGLPLNHAAALGGITYETLLQWRKERPEFSLLLEQAKAQGIKARMKVIIDAIAKGDTQCARWWAEKTVAGFAKTVLDHEVKISGEVGVTLGLAQDTLDRIAAARTAQTETPGEGVTPHALPE